MVLARYITGAEGYETGPVGYYPNVYTFSSTGKLGITATGALKLATTDQSEGTVAIDYLLEDISTILMMGAAKASVSGRSVWAYIVEREGADAGKIVGSTTSDTVTINSVRVDAITMADIHVASSAIFLSDRGWPAEYFVGIEASGQTFEGISTVVGVEYGLNWLLVAGQNTTCAFGHVWQHGLCIECDNGFEPKEHNIGEPDQCVPCGLAQAGIHGHCANRARNIRGGGQIVHLNHLDLFVPAYHCKQSPLSDNTQLLIFAADLADTDSARGYIYIYIYISP
jgi:hypothetical protein